MLPLSEVSGAIVDSATCRLEVLGVYDMPIFWGLILVLEHGMKERGRLEDIMASLQLFNCLKWASAARCCHAYLGQSI